MIYTLLVLRLFTRGQESSAAELPAPGPAPHARSDWGFLGILSILVGNVLWLLGQGYSASAALGITAGIGLITAELSAGATAARPFPAVGL